MPTVGSLSIPSSPFGGIPRGHCFQEGRRGVVLCMAVSHRFLLRPLNKKRVRFRFLFGPWDVNSSWALSQKTPSHRLLPGPIVRMPRGLQGMPSESRRHPWRSTKKATKRPKGESKGSLPLDMLSLDPDALRCSSIP